MSDDDRLLTAMEEITRLTAERDEWKRLFHDLAAVTARKTADLAAARAVLEEIASLTLPSSAPAGMAKRALFRLGTGEALAVVREAIAILEEEGLHGVAARLKEAFGESEGK